MASWTSSDLLAQFNELAGRPSSDEITDATKYARLARAQMAVIEDVAGIYPYCMYLSSGPTTLTTSGNKVYTFGNDGQGQAAAPLGYAAIFRNLEDYPDNALIEGVDYLDEGTQIRIPNNRTESSTLYYTGIPTPTDIASGQEPALRPAPARRLIVIKAVEHFAREGGRDFALADDMSSLYTREFAKHMLAWRTRYRRGGAVSMTSKELAIVRSGGVI